MPYVGRRHGEGLLLDGVNGNGVAVLRAGKLGSLLPESGEALKAETQGDTFAGLPARADQVVAVACFQLRRQTQPLTVRAGNHDDLRLMMLSSCALRSAALAA